MNNHQKSVADNTALKPLTTTLGELSKRWTHAERETLVTGKLGFGTLASCFTATSKPFGTVFKPIRPEVKFEKHKALSVKSLARIASFYGEREVKPDVATKVYIGEGYGRFDKDERAERLAAANVSASAILTKVFNHRIKKRAKVDKVLREKRISYNPGVIGLDKVAEPIVAKPSQEEKERQDRNDLTQLGILYMSLFRAIYG